MLHILTVGLPETLECAAFGPEIMNKTDAHAVEAVKFEQSGEEKDGALLSPAILWGILISDCKEPACHEPNEAENGSLDAAEPGVSLCDNTLGKALDNPRPGPSLLWGILWPETSPEAMTESLSKSPGSKVLDTNASINLWIAAGYDCQLPMEEDAPVSSILADDRLIDDGDSMQYYEPPNPTGPFIVKESLGKGQGIFASRNIVRGERILVDKPFLAVTKPYNDEKVLEEFERMPFAKRREFMQLHCPDRSDDIHMTDVMSIFEANSFNIGHSAAIFLTATRFNHSCLPNTYYSWNEQRGEIVLHAMIDVAQDEEMTICYGHPFCTRLERRSEMQIYKFHCGCPACRIETVFGQASESRRLDMKALSEQIIMFQSSLNEALISYGLRDPLTAVLRLIDLIKQEGLHGELMTPYRDAANYLRNRGNFEEALQFARLELEEEVVCLGNDSEVVHKTIEYIEELELLLEKEVETAKESEGELEWEVKMSGDEWTVDSKADTWKTVPMSLERTERGKSSGLGEQTWGGSDKDMRTLSEEQSDTPPQNIIHDQDREDEKAEMDEPDEDSDFYEGHTIDALMDSRSSSPRLVRKKQ